MKRTLEQYIEPENIPRQYGGTLDYKFGELPNLEPAIINALNWSAPEKLNGKNTIPTGPIRWRADSNGTLNAIAVGSENEKPRERKVASITPAEKVSIASLGAGAQQVEQKKQDNLAVRQQQMYRTTSGIDTHPETPPEKDIDLKPAPTEVSASDSQVSSSSTGGTYLSYRDGPPLTTNSAETTPQTTATGAHENSIIDHPNPSQQGLNTISASRTGTSSTRYAEQSATHAHGTMAEGTPEVRDNGAGDKYGVMEPGTVGQAPKEHPMPETETPAPSYLEQAKAAVAGAGSAALAAVGYGGAEEEKEVPQEKSVPHDPAVDAAKDGHVEEYLRSQYPSKAAHDASAENKS